MTPVYDNYPAVDETNNFAPPVRAAFAASTELKNAIVTKISEQSTVEQAAVEAMNNAAVQAQLAWNKSAMTSGSLNSKVTPCTFPVTNLAVTDRPPIEAYGNCTVVPVASNAVVQEYRTNQAISTLWSRRGLTDGTSWSAWREIDAEAAIAKIYRGLLPSTADLNTTTEDGTYGVASATIANRPTTTNGDVEVRRVGTATLQRYTTVTAIPEVYERRINTDGSGGFDWVRTDAGALKAGSAQTGMARRELLKQKLLARKGIIGTANKGAIALRFDDAHAETASLVIPLLVERRLPFTRVTTSESINGVAIPAGSFTTMQSNCIQYGGEVWAHGKTHGEATKDVDIDAETIGALNTLRSAMPRIPIDCFAPPGGSVSWGGYLPGVTISSWADTRAGQNLIANYAIASGYLPDTYYRPLDGVLRDGQTHYSLDAYTLSNAKVRVDSARDWKVGIVFMFHANNLGTTGNMSVADFTAFLDYIVAQRDAGNLLVLTVSGLAVANKSISYRDDLLANNANHFGNPFAQSFTFPQFRQGIQGSTRELVATVTGTAGTSITSVIGESTINHIIPAGGILNLRHVATIPSDVTALTVSINGNASNVHLYTV
ncbi:minor tail protein [Arthrobacter phage JEGGS]|uniref:Minor tail protein n=1 Tax=Arthrobacter phage JEGGS TaxID=2591110 RepID=A0A515MLH6_9CAUD|nr:tail protein [Arthrobacter phage JEGGS]QDM57501.1 minor tail protein [Arthrobacter phage JEGGS]